MVDPVSDTTGSAGRNRPGTGLLSRDGSADGTDLEAGMAQRAFGQLTRRRALEAYSACELENRLPRRPDRLEAVPDTGNVMEGNVRVGGRVTG